MLIIVLALLLILVLSVISLKRTDECSDWNFTWLIITLISSIFLIITPIVWTNNYYSYKADINKYLITKQTITDSRNSKISDIERAALTSKIIEINQYIADAKYWNDTIFGDMIPDDYAELEYLK
ncbi:hypothetical protein [Paenibacillus pini]|uniref:Uncharacterized protein n=1 Tax=Paenibacillus pini JCM 16418 TaxID=1236976 RepID=W7YIH9_9BACL|nr:hypothetical protein [Paenibacillus pini]GAF10700.1 hypothetical protein JCM16418_4919 [Paenibacillus pini JCM 16418]